ncbi:alpha-1,4-glucan--maltose-1-phosphate maltosyltransferase [soil metagenome]
MRRIAAETGRICLGVARRCPTLAGFLPAPTVVVVETMLSRIVIDNIHPRTPDRAHPAKAAVGERVPVTAAIFRDGHDLLAARVRLRPVGSGTKGWTDVALTDLGNDEWAAYVEPVQVGPHALVIEAWTDRFATWRRDIETKANAGQDVNTELEEGAQLLERLAPKVDRERRNRVLDAVTGLRSETCSLDVRLNAGLDDAVAALLAGIPDSYDLTRSAVRKLWVDRALARAGAWYELFPRSEGGLAAAAKRLPAVAAMGFDIVYLPPIHPIGTTFRKGRNNSLHAEPDDPGSPWAIGGSEGGHTAIHPELGTVEDFDRFVSEAATHGMEVALDYALQCSPDHPWVRGHPEWFHHRPDGTIKYAENPPKKYQDIYPVNFWPAGAGEREALWAVCKAVIDHWIGHGVRVFRVDNPHTKPMVFWEWLIGAVRDEHPDVVFLAEAFTRPKVMAKLAEVGFTQSYTYFTWRQTKAELTESLTELAHGPLADYMRPNFWPNTPDILAGPLRHGNEAAFRLRYLRAATMTPCHGVYSGYELCENEPASDTSEEYLYSEKFEVKHRDWDAAGSLVPFITRVNEIRRAHPAFAELRTVRFHHVDNDQVLAFTKTDGHGDDPVLVVINLDPDQWHEATVSVDAGAFGLTGPELAGRGAFEAHDELTGTTYTWDGPHNYVRLDPAEAVGHVFSLRSVGA